VGVGWFMVGQGNPLPFHESLKILAFDATVTSHRFIRLDVTGLDPIDDGFGRDLAKLTGLVNG